ncbi:MAG TPA: aldehyde reductase [Acidimicrobiaceae bacterium]|nr:aldehyde reductase [Acidimicrobiaceae bacterium]
MTTSTPRTALVTGATGYIARQVIVQLLDGGHTVRGTARSTSSLDQLRADLTPHLADPAAISRFSLVAADLTSDAGWADAVAGCDVVHHVASPLPAAPPKHADELIVPARDGTLRVLRAALAAGVQRVVLTSSIAAILYGVDRRGRVFSEADWSNPDGPRIGAYEQSKTIAERAAWAFIEQEAAGRMELATVNPGLVIGPMIGDAMSTSNEAVKKLMRREFPACPDLTYAIVDVRDVAAAHVAAMNAPDAAGQRYLCALDSHSLRDMAAILHEEYGPRGYRIPTGKLPGVALRLVALWDKTAALALGDLSNPQRVDNAKVTALLGRPLRDLRTATVAMADSLERYGHVAPKRPPKATSKG